MNDLYIKSTSTLEEQMKIGIIDADLLGRKKHRFPNLACEKISGYWKERGAEVNLLMNYNWSDDYDHIYISKVFTDTPIPVEHVPYFLYYHPKHDLRVSLLQVDNSYQRPYELLV